MAPLPAFCAAPAGLPPLGAARQLRRAAGARPGARVTVVAARVGGAPASTPPALPPPSSATAASPPPPATGVTTRRAALRAAATAAAAVVAAAAVGPPPQPAAAISIGRLMKKAGPEQEMDNGIRYREVIVGKGFEPNIGDTVAIHYSLYCGDIEVESSRESQGLAASPLGFTYGAEAGAGAVLKGINLGMEGMKVGGQRLMVVPPELAYGARGKPPLVPPNATVEFAVSLLSVRRSGTNPNSVINLGAQVY